MKIVDRKPNFKIEIIRPNLTIPTSTSVAALTGVSASFYNSSEKIAVFLPTKTINVINGYESNGLTSYSFRESIHDISGPFSLTVVAETGRRSTSDRVMLDATKATWFERVRPFDVVYIWEFTELRYIGIVHDINISGNISSGTVRNITISGSHIMSILSTFNVVLDMFITSGSQTAVSASQVLMDAISSKTPMGAPIAGIYSTIYNSFMKFMDTMATVGTGGAPLTRSVTTMVKALIDMDNGISKDVVTHFNISLTLYQTGANNLWSMFTQVTPAPAYELFGRINPSSKMCEMVSRETPFDLQRTAPTTWGTENVRGAWFDLPRRAIPMHYITDYNFVVSDREVYTFYEGFLEGAGYGERGVLLLDDGLIATQSSVGVAAVDVPHWIKYGYRPLMTAFRYFDRSQASSYTDAQNAMALLSKRLKNWYGQNDYFLRGTLNCMTIDPTDGTMDSPRIGERLMIDAAARVPMEWYVEETSHGFTYGGPMTTQFTLGRGAGYDAASYGSQSYEQALAQLSYITAQLKALGGM